MLGSMLPVVPPLFARFIVSAGDAPEMARLLTTIDIYAASLIVPHWTVVVTEAILAVIVMVMKGPACVADAYPLDTPTLRHPGGMTTTTTFCARTGSPDAQRRRLSPSPASPTSGDW
ncbi:hypothetical protein [Accumulibacter sp.]|uniref:hypothetical protein n=1 Tax=Accumulibacter sp. TaxID=2053492 RepID=UPI0025D73671|nr:hypothetical protein [Accumulibacter sp.]